MLGPPTGNWVTSVLHISNSFPRPRQRAPAPTEVRCQLLPLASIRSAARKRQRERERRHWPGLSWTRVGTPNWLFANLELNSLNTCQNIQFTVLGMLVIGFRLLPHVHFALLNNFICDSDSGREFLPLCRCKVCYSVTVSLNFDSSLCCEVSSKGDAVLVLLYAQEDQKQISDIVIILIRFFCGKSIRGSRARGWGGAGISTSCRTSQHTVGIF